METNGRILTQTVDKIVGPAYERKLDPSKLIGDALAIMTEAENLRMRNSTRLEKKIGLVYGKVQSGKTNAMIASTALAFDNGYKIAIILTSNNIELVEQTRDRFQDKVRWTEGIVETYLYQDLKDNRTLSLESLRQPDVRMIVVAAKGSKSLESVISFLEKFDDGQRAIIFDDEGDNYSLDNNRKARDEDEDLAPTRINDLIFSRLRNKMDHVLVSVTGTPQGVLLEGTNESLGFKYLLEPGSAYVGGETFFSEDVLENNAYISAIDTKEVEDIVKTGAIRSGLRDALMDFYVVSNLYNAETGKYAEFLCHPHQTVATHQKFKEVIESFHNSVVLRLSEKDPDILAEFRRIFDSRKLKNGKIRYFDQLEKLLPSGIMKTKILLMNAKQKDSMVPERHHILIGGNILGRGVTIENMLVMYYSRNAKTTNMDTLYQHARMFGYRRPMLDFMRIYLPEELYAKFHATYETDEGLREMVRKYPYENFPIRFYDNGTGLRLTRPQIESKSFLSDVFIPRRQFYPNNVSEEVHKKNAKKYEELAVAIKALDGQLADIETVAGILSKIDTTSKNQWKDGRPIAILRGLMEDESDKRIRISRNDAETRSWKKGAIGTGTLDGTRVDTMRKDDYVGICFSSFAYKDRPELGKFWYPTIVFPEKMDGLGKVYVTKG